MLCTLAIAGLAYGQTPAIEWQKFYGGTKDDDVISIRQTSDGGYIFIGDSDSNNGDLTSNNGKKDFWVVKSNPLGAIQWQRSLGGSQDEEAHSIRQTADGGYIIAGETNSNDGDVTGNHGGTDAWIVKLNQNGDLVWQKTYGGSNSDSANFIEPTGDGGYIVAGDSNSNNGDLTQNKGSYDAWVFKISSDGTLEWQKNYGGTAYEGAEYIQNTSDGGYIVAATTTSNNGDLTSNHGDFDYWFIKLNSAGNIEWQKTYGGTGMDQPYAIHQTLDGGYIASGRSNTPNNGDVTGNHGQFDYWIVKVSNTGDLIWQKSLGGTNSDYGRFSQPTLDGGYIVAGYSNSNNGNVSGNNGGFDCWIAKLNETGTIEWQKSLGGTGYDWGRSLTETEDGGFVIALGSKSTNISAGTHHGNNDVLLIKLEGNGSLSTSETSMKKELTVAPNPSNGYFTINHLFNNSSLEVYSLSGKLIQKVKNISGKSYSIDISHQPTGAYIIRIDNLITLKLIKK